MLDLLYFAWIKERMGRNDEKIALPAGVRTVADLAAFLQSRDEAGARAFSEPALVRAAVNQEFATAEMPVHDGDEVAFFPPVTGG
jgi:molybdopterin synthase sulfur carrier subunit